MSTSNLLKLRGFSPKLFVSATRLRARLGEGRGRNRALFPEGTTARCGNIPKEIAALPITSDTYIVIVTRGHKLDAEAFEACIHTPAAYIGMIGSKRKVALIRNNFIESGFATEEEFDRVFAPIGLDIAAVTVPEIAASITAQLIAVRRKSNPHLPPGEKELQ